MFFLRLEMSDGWEDERRSAEWDGCEFTNLGGNDLHVLVRMDVRDEKLFNFFLHIDRSDVWTIIRVY